MGGVHFINAKANHSLYFQEASVSVRKSTKAIAVLMVAGYMQRCQPDEFFERVRYACSSSLIPLSAYALDEQDTLEDESLSGVAGANDSIYAPVFGFSIGGGFLKTEPAHRSIAE